MEITTIDSSQIKEDTPLKLMKLSALEQLTRGTSSNPWTSSDIDRLEFNTDDFIKITKACRFFYKKDPIASSTINKLVEIGINNLKFERNGLSENEYRIFLAIKEDLETFSEMMALEYLISGLVVPEVRYSRVNKEVLKKYGIKKYTNLVLPVTLFVRDPDTVKIKKNPLEDTPSYFIKIPDEAIQFIRSGGKFGDGTKDINAFLKLKSAYPDFVTAVLNGETELLIEDPSLIIRRKYQPNDPYPIPYLSAALESLKHKRNLRRMDYSIASRVISAIQLFKLGDKDFPVTEEDGPEQFQGIKDQIYWRDGTGYDVERIFQLFANHTLQIEWIVPDTQALLNEQKYISVNQDIIYSLGFPRILITGESERTGTSDPQYAMMSPSRTMENFRDKIVVVIQQIVDRIAEYNNLKTSPTVSFEPLTLFDHQTLLKSLADLYAGGNLSRTTYAKTLGYSWEDETELRQAEKAKLSELGLDEVAPSNKPGAPNGGNPNPRATTTPATNENPSNPDNTSNNKNGAN